MWPEAHRSLILYFPSEWRVRVGLFSAYGDLVEHDDHTYWTSAIGHLEILPSFQKTCTLILHISAVSSSSFILFQFQRFMLLRDCCDFEGSCSANWMVLSLPTVSLESGFWCSFRSSEFVISVSFPDSNFFIFYFCPLSFLSMCFFMSLCPFVPFL